jgi:hypothetical protein
MARESGPGLKDCVEAFGNAPRQVLALVAKALVESFSLIKIGFSETDDSSCASIVVVVVLHTINAVRQI